MLFFKKKGAESQHVYIVYGSRSPSAPEPVIAVVLEEDEASLIESEAVQRHPHAVVQWETLPIQGFTASPPQKISVLFTFAGFSPDADPIAIQAFTDEGEARSELARVRGGLPHEVRTYSPGWRTAEWPFEQRQLSSG